MNSLHNFDRSLDKFLAWLSEAESSMEGLEAEADRLGGRRDQGALRRPQHQLKVSPYFCLYKNSRILLFRVFIPWYSVFFLSLIETSSVLSESELEEELREDSNLYPYKNSFFFKK